jgi:ubiquinone/menaquinone biosynthesis C-methylase UbiE
MVSLVDRSLVLFLRFFFYLIYNPLAWTYDWVAAVISRGRWIEWTYTTLPYLSGDRVLELGHGPGHLQVAMSQRGKQVYGLDLSRTMGKIARHRIIRALQPHRLVRGKAQYLPFSAGVFDQIVTTFPSEYLFRSQTLAEIHRVLSPDGLLVVLPVAWIGRGSRIDRGLGRIYQLTHQAPPRKDEQWEIRMIELFQKAGFDVRTETIAIASSEIFLVLASSLKLL